MILVVAAVASLALGIKTEVRSSVYGQLEFCFFIKQHFLESNANRRDRLLFLKILQEDDMRNAGLLSHSFMDSNYLCLRFTTWILKLECHMN